MRQEIFGFPVELDGEWDFGFIRNYGTPFWVQARPERGTLLFGTEGPRYGRLLIRFAGALLTGGIAAAYAVQALRDVTKFYETLYGHRALIRLQGYGPAAGGYASIYRWPEGANLRLQKAQERLRRQPLLIRLSMLHSLFDFHMFALEHGFVPTGLREDCLTVDFQTGSVTVCDIDLYSPAGTVGNGLFGTSRFLAPEAYQPVPLEDAFAQYAMGELAFFFLGAYGGRERADWTAGEALYQIALRACRERPEQRYPSLEEFISAWREAAGKALTV